MENVCTSGACIEKSHYLVGRIHISADSGPTRLKHIWCAQRSGGYGCSALQPAVLFQIREFETPLWIYSQ